MCFQVKLEVLDLDADCSKDFITLYNGDLPTAPHLSAPLCGNNLPGEWITQGHQLFVEFHSGAVDPLKPHRGFQLRLTQDTSGSFQTLLQAIFLICSTQHYD